MSRNPGSSQGAWAQAPETVAASHILLGRAAESPRPTLVSKAGPSACGHCAHRGHWCTCPKTHPFRYCAVQGGNVHPSPVISLAGTVAERYEESKLGATEERGQVCELMGSGWKGRGHQ